MSPPRTASLDAPSTAAYDRGASSSLSSYVHSNLMPEVRLTSASPKELPTHLNFTNDIYPSTSAKDQILKTPADKISFTTPAQDKSSGSQPDYYLNTEGKLVKNPQAKPSKDGSVKIEVEGNNSAKDAKQYADKLQKQAIGDLVSAYKAAHPGEKVPEMWQSILDSQPDTNYPNTGDGQNNNTVTPQEERAYESQASSPPVTPPADSNPAPQQPSDTGSSNGGASQSGGSDAGSGGGGSSGGGGGSSGGGGGGESGIGGGGGGSSAGGGGTDAGAGGGSTSSGTTYDGASGNVDQKTLLDNVKIVAEVAKQLGVDPTTAVADMLVESGGNNKAVGDGGHSIGLSQLNDAGGEGTGMSVAQREDPKFNAEIALSHFAKGQAGDPGQVAFNAENPKDEAAYVKAVDAQVPHAQQLLKQAGVA